MADKEARSASSIFSEIELLQLILHSLGEGVVVADADGKFVLWNPEAERIVGKGMSDVPMDQWTKEYGAFDPETKEPYPSGETPLARALRGERTDGIELFIRNPRVPEGVYIRGTGRPIRDLKGQLLGGVVVFRDTTAERRAQEAQRRLAAIVTSSHDGIFGLAPDGRVAECNHSGGLLFGVETRELRGRRAASLASERSRPELEREIKRALEGGLTGILTVEFERKDKRLFWGSTTLAPIKLPDGPLIGLSMTVRDETERRKVEAMRDELLAVASHELRAPTASVQLSLEMLREDLARLPHAEKERKLLETALTGCERLIHLLGECLDVERARLGKAPPLHLTREDLVALLQESVATHEAYARGRGVALESKGLFGEAYARVDRTRLLQAVSNLITNAAKFSPKGETTVVGLERLPGSFRIYIADKGPGILPEFKDRVFERFARPRTPQTEQVEGAGLGLSIAKEIVEAHGGRIGFDSEAGQGATFTIDLDAAA